MATLKDIVATEQDNRAALQSWSTVYLFNENGFWRAYEWSAWLFCRYIKEYTVKRRGHKGYGLSDDTTVMIGFPSRNDSSLPLPEGTEAARSDDGMRMEYKLPATVFGVDAALEDLTVAFLNWKKSYPVEDYKKDDGDGKPKENRESKLTDVLKDDSKTMSEMRHMSDVVLRIMSFPIEQKSPIDCMNFLIEMKKQIITFF